ncbi:MAG TPA: hypothetical protein PLJ21_11910 [Pseudobdellovibrionaceae bacterium]|mgnify:CR=1 FL=1|nr:hypothetical protein [Pseudobdellovibrionaceae bacterium]
MKLKIIFSFVFIGSLFVERSYAGTLSSINGNQIVVQLTSEEIQMNLRAGQKVKLSSDFEQSKGKVHEIKDGVCTFIVSKSVFEQGDEITIALSKGSAKKSKKRNKKEWYVAGFIAYMTGSASGSTTVTVPDGSGGTTTHTSSASASVSGFTVPGLRAGYWLGSVYLGGEFLMTNYTGGGSDTLINIMAELPLDEFTVGGSYNLSNNSSRGSSTAHPIGGFVTYEFMPNIRAMGSVEISSASGATATLFRLGAGYYY